MTSTAPQSSSFISSVVRNLLDHFKPHRAEALQRIRVNTFWLLMITILSNLLPLPTVQSALRVVSSSKRPERWESDWLYRWFCIAEATCAVVFGFNILESLYAVNYPRRQPPPTLSTSKSIYQATPTPKRAFKVLSPNSSPQTQKTFSMSQSGTFSTSPSKYPSSPRSTPSRVINYPSVINSSTNTQASSTSTMFHSTPSPVVSAYRGKHLMNVGHALDGSFLGRLQQPDDSNDDESQSLGD